MNETINQSVICGQNIWFIWWMWDEKFNLFYSRRDYIRDFLKITKGQTYIRK